MGKTKDIFTIQMLDDKDYLNLHKQFSEIDEKDLHKSLGFADKESGEAYIRKTSVKDVDMATVQHEIQELMSDTSDHEKNGIRFGWFHKAFGFSSQPAVNVAAPILASMIPGVGPVLSGLLGAGTSAATQKLNTGKISPAQVALSGVGGGLLKGAMVPGISAAKEAGKGILGQTWGGLKSAVGITPATAKTAGSAASTIGSGAGSPMKAGFDATQAASTIGSGAGLPMKAGFNATQAALPGATTPVSLGGSAYNVANSASKGLSLTTPAADTISSILGSTANLKAPTPPEPVATPISPTATTGSAAPAVKKTFMQKLKDGAISAGKTLAVGGLTSALIPSAEYESPSSLEALRSNIQSGKSATMLGEAARTDLLNTIQTSYDELYPVSKDAYYEAVLRKTDEAYENALEELDKSYNLAGVYGSGEHLAARDKLQEDLANTKTDLYATTEEANKNLAINAKYQAVQQALQVDQATMDDLVGVTGLDVTAAAIKYGAEAADVQAIREALGTMASEVIA